MGYQFSKVSSAFSCCLHRTSQEVTLGHETQENISKMLVPATHTSASLVTGDVVKVQAAGVPVDELSPEVSDSSMEIPVYEENDSFDYSSESLETGTYNTRVVSSAIANPQPQRRNHHHKTTKGTVGKRTKPVPAALTQTAVPRPTAVVGLGTTPRRTPTNLPTLQQLEQTNKTTGSPVTYVNHCAWVAPREKSTTPFSTAKFRNRPKAAKGRRAFPDWIQAAIEGRLAPEAFNIDDEDEVRKPGCSTDPRNIHNRPKAAKGERRPPIQSMIIPTGHSYLAAGVGRRFARPVQGQSGMNLFMERCLAQEEQKHKR